MKLLQARNKDSRGGWEKLDRGISDKVALNKNKVSAKAVQKRLKIYQLNSGSKEGRCINADISL